MTRTLLLRLAWKEYRAIRAFWISLLALVALAVLGVVTFSIPGGWTTNLVYMIALGAPAFFALGCAGTAFALEREEGTYEQLRAWPVEAWQLLVSKLAVTVVATAAMFAAAWPIALWATGRDIPQSEMLHDILALWLTAAIEAIAWGTFFSLLNARPLMAVLMGLFVSTSLAHLLSWMVAADAHSFFVKHYVQAVPLRLLVAGAALAIDIYLGLRWLDLSDTVRSRSQFRLPPLFRRKTKVQTIDSLVRRPERLAAIGRLFWQTWRQSRWAMCTIVLCQISLTGLLLATSAPPDYASILLLIPFWAAIAGSLVFHSDQERNHYRFFIEHNVSPRWMWLTRQLPWLIVQACAAAIQIALVLGVLFIRHERLNDDLAITNLAPRIFSPAPGVFLMFVAWISGFAAGQWTSIFVKSGLLAGSFGIALTILLGGWVAFTSGMHISPLWTVAPMVAALMVGTWLRSPDWIADNTSWRARLQAATVVLAPALAILIGVAAYRAYQIPLVDPGFDPDSYLAAITPESRETAEMFRLANDTLEPSRPGVDWLETNKDVLALLVEASQRPSCTLYDPWSPNSRVNLFNSNEIIRLICASGDKLQSDGKLDEAVDRYLCALRSIALWCDHLPTTSLLRTRQSKQFHAPIFAYSSLLVGEVYEHIKKWSVADGQTAERIRLATARLSEYGSARFKLADQVKSNYLVALKAISGNEQSRQEVTQYFDGIAQRLTLLDWMPWERTRELRAQNEIASDGLQRIEGLEKLLQQPAGRDYRIDQSRLMRDPYSLFQAIYSWNEFLKAGLGNEVRDVAAARELLAFEERHRALRLQLAIQSYILEHRRRPHSLDELRPKFGERSDQHFFNEPLRAQGVTIPERDHLPFDPYTGRNFVYFPDGILLYRAGVLQSPGSIWEPHLRAIGWLPGQPGFWSPDDQIPVSPWVNLDGDSDVIRQLGNSYDVVYKAAEHPDEPFPTNFFDVFTRGHWYPITVPADEQDQEAKPAKKPAAATANPEIAVP